METEAGSGGMAPRRESLAEEHTPEAIRARLRGGMAPSRVKDAILGATDGCVTTFAVVAGSIGGNLPERTVLILGFANLIADGFSMAASNYLASKSLNDELAAARNRELTHIREIPAGETEEIRQIFAAKGFSGEVLERIVEVIVGDQELWIRTMLAEELGLRARDALPMRAALATFVAFCIAGLVPLGAFLVPGLADAVRFPASCAMTASAFFAIGFAKGSILGEGKWRSGFSTFWLGCAAAGLAYLAGTLLGRLQPAA